jgi:Ca-activated chloride channel family protein
MRIMRKYLSITALLFGMTLMSIAMNHIVFSQAAHKQAPDALTSDTIRVSSNLVTVPVSVTDPQGNAVADLEAEDFVIQEDGKNENIAKMIDAGQSPLQLALLFDISGSVNSLFEFEQEAAIRFLEKVWKQGDAITIISFNEEPRVLLKNSNTIKEAFQELLNLAPTESPTAFYDSVVYSADVLQNSAPPESRKAEIVLSDGEDNRSDHTIVDALRKVQQSDVLFYSINPGGASIRLNEISIKGQQVMNSLAAQTGGSAFVSDNLNNLDAIFSRIATELRTQYLLGYYSSNASSNSQFRRIRVSLPNHPDFSVRARQGYCAN